jgi:DNA-binding MarR family transcriptional regulator
MTDPVVAETAIAQILDLYPSLTAEDAVAFLCVCAEDGPSLKALSKRLDVGQSVATRRVSALESCGGHGLGLVLMSRTEEGEVRRTVHLTPVGQELRDTLRVSRT